MHHLIFEGAELSGKSWLMSQIYDYLEPRYNKSGKILDGCHWFNCDVGIYGSEHGLKVNEKYLAIFSELKEENILVEKFHISDIVYNRILNGLYLDYYQLEKNLSDLGFKIILCTFPEKEELIASRLADRLRLYPHYKRISHEPAWYIEQQHHYLEELKKTALPYLILETDYFPNQPSVDKILTWINEKSN